VTDAMHTMLRQLGDQLGLPYLAWDGNDCCGLDFDHGLHAEIRYVDRAEALNLVLELGMLPAPGAGDVLRWLAAANLDPALLDQAQFALDTETGGLYLCRTLDGQGLDAAALMAALRGMVSIGKRWQASITPSAEAPGA
jgi:hypothetical protein